MKQVVINGDNIEVLKGYPDNYFDAVVTDPPYGLGKEPDAVELMKDWVANGYHEISGSGFMGKEWDAFIPQPIFWKEVFRVLKHGGHVVSFFGTRTYDWGVMSMRFAGFEIRDCIQWLYGSGFPKSHNISKAIDKLHGAEREVTGSRISAYGDTESSETNDGRNLWGKESTKEVLLKDKPSTKEAEIWEGWGSALKPANEPIVLARKPLEKGLSIAENVLKYGTGGINIDGCRVETDEIIENHSRGEESAISKGKYGDSKEQETHQTEGQKLGRFPANLILTHHPECECKGTKKIKGSSCKPDDVGKGRNESYNNGIYSDKKGIITVSHNDENGEETVEDWNCHPDCPIRIMDEQSGISKSSGGSGDKSMGGLGVNGKYGKFALNIKGENIGGLGDTGGASRFFYCAKASKSERNKGLDGFEEKENKHSTYGIHSDEGLLHNGRNPENRSRTMSNFHPTVKPVKLMQYLARLITPPNGKVLDPFCGSGTTGIACKLEGFEFVGIEQDPDYTQIAQARITNWTEEKESSKQKNKESDKTESAITQTKLF